MNALARAIGHRFFERGSRGRFEWRLSWAEISGRCGFAVALCLFGEHWSLHLHLVWPNVFIRLPFLQRWHREPYERMESWGFSLFRTDGHFNWGSRCKIIHWPWSPTWVRTSLLMADGTWLHETTMRRCEFPNYPLSHSEKKPWGTWHKVKDELSWRETYPYRYVLRSGEVQERTAEVRVEEREWRMRWFQWLPIGQVQRSIDVKFNAEVGERTGSWKGGCTGCGYTLRHDQMPREALNEMERERTF